MDKPLISIITINFNDLEGLKRTMTSVLEQTWQEFEYIVIDGGSSDGSKEYIESHQEKINYWVSEPDTGIYNGMNKGIKASTGEYLLFLNSGDEFYSSMVLEQNENLIHTQDLIYFDICLIFPQEQKIHHYPNSLSFNTFKNGAIGHPTTFIKNDMFNKIGLYDENLKIVSDWKFFLTAVVQGCSYKKVNSVLSKFYMDGISSTNLQLVEQERNKILWEEFKDSMGVSPSMNILQRLKKLKLSHLINLIRFQKLKHRKLSYIFIKILSFYRLQKEKLKYLLLWTKIKMSGKFTPYNEYDTKTFPIIIISFNQLHYLKKLISFLQKCGQKNIIIIDNASTYKPLLKFLEGIEKEVIIHRVPTNKGHKVFWQDRIFFKLYGQGYYAVTDADIVPHKECPHNFINYFKEVLDQNTEITKVGFSLSLNDIPDSNSHKNKIIMWENKFWKRKNKDGNYLADIDTTFALYKPKNLNAIENNFFKAIRLQKPFEALHGGWHINTQKLTEEQIFYMKNAGESSSWRLNEDGDLVDPKYLTH